MARSVSEGNEIMLVERSKLTITEGDGSERNIKKEPKLIKWQERRELKKLFVREKNRPL